MSKQLTSFCTKMIKIAFQVVERSMAKNRNTRTGDSNFGNGRCRCGTFHQVGGPRGDDVYRCVPLSRISYDSCSFFQVEGRMKIPSNTSYVSIVVCSNDRYTISLHSGIDVRIDFAISAALAFQSRGTATSELANSLQDANERCPKQP